MNDRFASTCNGLIIAVVGGWLLVVGQSAFAPLEFGVLVVHVIAGLTQLSARIPVIGARLPTPVRHPFDGLYRRFSVRSWRCH